MDTIFAAFAGLALMTATPDSQGAPCAQPAPTAEAPAQVADLGWMAGQWDSADGENWVEEYWTVPRAGIMLGANRSGRGDTMADFEFLRVEETDGGVPTYFGQPRGRPPVAFRMIQGGQMSVVFENTTHDYPQRIQYRRDGDALTATISMADGSNAISWRFQRRVTTNQSPNSESPG